MARISVYVPDSMKERMDALDDRVNWSEAAQTAFEREIAIATIPKDPKMNEVIERLRTSKAKFEQAEAETGRQHGRDWAKSQASYEQLKVFGELQLHGREFASQVDRALGNSNDDWHDSFWFEPDIVRLPSDEYVEAFVEGAKDIWNEVADKI